MSDKKQPAQQRVNVRIVKADDPEQRGGMKPISKADGSLQISPEEAYTAGIWTKPPFDLRGLSKMVDESTILPQCIRAYKSNIAGFGIDIRYKDDFADADETPEMKAEWDRATEVVEMLNMEQESNELFEDIVEARETYGCAYAEVIRDMDGNVIQLEFIEDTPSVEKSRRLDPRVEVTYFHRDHTENRMRKFRKYKQTVNGKTVYYKEFGDPRIMDPTSGEYVTELEFKSRANEIIEFAIGTATYGKVRWVGSILTVDGARRAESLNNNYFLNGRHTPLLIMVKGGSLTDDSFAKLKEYMNGIRGEAGQHSFMVLETEAADNRTGFNAENRPEVEVKDLAAILQKDELFQDYLENNRRKVQSAFQLPDLYTGYTTDFNRATAQTAMEVTEKQVFQPERRRLAWAINNRLLNCYQFKGRFQPGRPVQAADRLQQRWRPHPRTRQRASCTRPSARPRRTSPRSGATFRSRLPTHSSGPQPSPWQETAPAWRRMAVLTLASENAQPETKPAQNAQQGGPSVEEQLDGQIQKAAAANETELVAVMKEVRRLLADMKQEEGDAGVKCLRCGPLIKAIDAYLAKAENDLYEQLTMEGYLKAKESLNTVDEIEEVVTKLLEDNADDLLKELADAIDLETFFKDNWPKFKNKSKLAQDLFDVFHTQFSTIMPTYVEAYVQKTDAELTVTKLTKRTTDWISSWSSDLADIMKLDTETEIEAVLKKGLNDGKGVLRAHGYAQLESYIQSPAVEEKMWKHTGAYRNDPRQNHVDMDGVHVPKGQPFTLIELTEIPTTP